MKMAMVFLFVLNNFIDIYIVENKNKNRAFS